MDLGELNLRQLLEVGLRFPEIGSVDFNIVYLILKTIINNQGLESLTPQSVTNQSNISASSDEKVKVEEEKVNLQKINEIEKGIQKIEANYEKVKEEEKAKLRKMAEMEGDIQKLGLITEKLIERISELDKLPKSKDKELDKQDTSHSASELEVKIDIESKNVELTSKPADVKENRKSAASPEQKFLQSKFSWYADKTLGANMESIKKKYEPLKESDQKEYWHEMVEMKKTNEMITKKFDILTQEFGVVMDRIDQLTTQMEELDKSVSEKFQIDDDLDKLKKQIDRIDAYVFTGKHKTDTNELQGAHSITERREDTEYVTGEVEKPKRLKERTYFQRTVKNLMSAPEEKRAEIKKDPIQPEPKKVKPKTMKRAYELYIEATRIARAGKGVPAKGSIEGEKVEPEEVEKIEVQEVEKSKGEEAEKNEGKEVVKNEGEEVVKINIDVPAGQDLKMTEAENLGLDPIQQVENPTRDLIERRESLPPIRRTTQKKFRTATQAITLLQDVHETHRFRKLPNIRQLVIGDSDDEQMIGEHTSDLSSESFEIGKPPTKQASVKQRISVPGKPTLLSGDQHLKEQIVLYVKTRLEKAEDKFMEQIQTLDTSMVELQFEYEAFKKEMNFLNIRLSKVETNQSRLEGRLIGVEEKANLTYLRIEELLISLDKKADRSDVLLGVTKKDLCVLEKKMHEINEICLSDIEDLKGVLKGYTAKNQDELNQKMSGLEVNSRLEPLTGRLRSLEKSLKDVYFTLRVLENQFMGPIEVRRYMHCKDGKRIMPLERQMYQRTSACQIVKKNPFPDGVDSKKLEADLQKKLFDVVLRDSKRFIGGAYTKGKVAGT